MCLISGVMNEFVPRIDALAADHAAAMRPVPAVPVIQPPASARNFTGGDDLGSNHGKQARREHMASAVDYARVQARVADILANLANSAQPSAAAQSDANMQLQSLLPQPVVIVPLPPVTLEAIERAVEVARAMADQAALTRVAQANVGAGLVDQILAA